MKKKLLIILCLCTSQLAVQSQTITPQIINAQGGTATLGANTVEWSIGEMVAIKKVTMSNLIVTQGLLQPNDSKPDGVRDNELLEGKLSVYPNPASDNFTIKTIQLAQGEITYTLLNMQGKKIIEKSFDTKSGTQIHTVNIHHLASGTYALNLYYVQHNGQKGNDAYKIQKLK